MWPCFCPEAHQDDGDHYVHDGEEVDDGDDDDDGNGDGDHGERCNATLFLPWGPQTLGPDFATLGTFNLTHIFGDDDDGHHGDDNGDDHYHEGVYADDAGDDHEEGDHGDGDGDHGGN